MISGCIYFVIQETKSLCHNFTIIGEFLLKKKIIFNFYIFFQEKKLIESEILFVTNIIQFLSGFHLWFHFQ